MLRRIVVQARARALWGRSRWPWGSSATPSSGWGTGRPRTPPAWSRSGWPRTPVRRTSSTSSLVWLAQVEAVRGSEEECRAHAGRALELVEVTGAESMRHLGQGGPRPAGARAGAARRDDRAARVRRAVRQRPEPRGAGCCSGRAEPDRGLLERGPARGRRRRLWPSSTSGPSGRGACGRGPRPPAATGCSRDDDEFEDHFSRALELHRPTALRSSAPEPSCRSANGCAGRRRRADARPWLRRALETFEHLGRPRGRRRRASSSPPPASGPGGDESRRRIS